MRRDKRMGHSKGRFDTGSLRQTKREKGEMVLELKKAEGGPHL